eukprot:XP_016879696.1 UDP-GlcNAc:betaGal beta-1,3-N-acetylglucosaminyltransferase-like protein 1 isoform X4 [Homo sapiens]
MSGAGVGGASEESQAMQAHVSIILPVHNAEPWLDECLRSVLQQDFEGTMELSVFNDASKDKSGAIIEKWRVKLEDSGVHVIIGGHDSPSPRGVGYAKNQAVAQSSGSYLCFLDSVPGLLCIPGVPLSVSRPLWPRAPAYAGIYAGAARSSPPDPALFLDHQKPLHMLLVHVEVWERRARVQTG